MPFSARNARPQQSLPLTAPKLDSWDALVAANQHHLHEESDLRALPFDAGQVVLSRLAFHAESKNWNGFEDDLRRLVSPSLERIAPALTQRISNARDPQGASLFQIVIGCDGGYRVLNEVLRSGIQPSRIPYRLYFDQDKPDHALSFGSLLHYSAFVGNARCVSELLNAGFDPDVLDSDNRTSLQICGSGLLHFCSIPRSFRNAHHDQLHRDLIHSANDLLKFNAHPFWGSPRHESFYYAYLRAAPRLKYEWLSRQFETTFKRKHVFAEVGGGLASTELAPLATKLIANASKLQQNFPVQFDLGQTNPIAFEEAVLSGASIPTLASIADTLIRIREGRHDEAESKRSLTRAVPDLMYRLPPIVAREVVWSIDRVLFQMESNPWEPELLGFFAVERLMRDGDFGAKLGEAITAPYNFRADRIDELSPTMCQNLGMVGTFTWSHKKWKADSSRMSALSTSCPLEDFGFSRLTPHPSVGSGFRHSTSSGWIELWQGCILGSFEDCGSILIANSSPEFNRGLFEHPCYYSPQYLSLSAQSDSKRSGMINPFFRHWNCFTHLLDRELYKSKSFEEVLAMQLAQLQAPITALADWRCSTRLENAWVNGKAGMHLAQNALYNSPGLKRILKNAREFNHIKHGSEPYYSLSWVHRMHPPFSPYTYRGPDNLEHRELVLTNDVINAIEARISRAATRHSAETSGEHQFFATGIKHEAELIVNDFRRRAR